MLGILIIAIAVLAPATGGAQPPTVDWRRTDWYPTHPVNGNQTKVQSGEDWWYDHVTSHSGLTVDGFACAGFSSFTNWGIDESTMGGCINTTPGPGFDCEDFETSTYKKGGIVSVLGMINAAGTGSPTWIKKFNEGTFFRVIEDASGGFVAIGQTASTREPFTGTPLYYNPDQSSGDVTDQFDDGTACSAGSFSRHITVVKVDHSGNTQWQFIYGMTPYRDLSNTPIPSVAYANWASGFGLTQTPDGGYLLVGNAFDPAYGFGRICMIKIDGNGHWLWGGFYGPTDQSSCGQSITTYGTGAALRYVLSGTEFFPGITFNGYTGSNLYQRALVMQFDGSVTGAPTAYQWMDNSFDVNYTASQSNYDVQIQQDGANTILLPIIVNGTNCLYSGYNDGQAKVYRLDPTTGAIAGSTSFGEVTAYDLKARVCPTADGGFGLVSTKRPNCPPDPITCHPETRYWGTDAYIARCNACGAIVWESTYDDGNTTPSSFPNNVKLQECLYAISQGADGGFVVSGNTSDNFDDDYLLKLDPEVTLPMGLYMQDTPTDAGLEPNPDTGPMWISSDIWVRNAQDDALFSHANQHQNPEYRDPNLLDPNYIYVRVRHRGCDATPSTGQLKVYCAPASTGLAWPTDWTNNITFHGQQVLGEVTSTLSPINVSLSGNSDQIFEIPWYPADPATYGSHMCILARVETPAGMTTTEGTSTNANVRNNNDIIWKNVTVVDLLPGLANPNHVGVRNVYATNGTVQLTFKLPPDELGTDFFNQVKVTVDLGAGLAGRWKAGGQQGSGITKITDQVVRINSSGAWIGNLPLSSAASYDVIVTFERIRGAGFASRTTYNLDMVQTSKAHDSDPFELIGGERYVIHARATDDEPRRTTGGVSGRDHSVTRTVPIGTMLMESIPNPIAGPTAIHCTIPAAGHALIRLYDAAGREVRVLLDGQRDAGSFEVHADLTDLPSGSYTARLTVDGISRSIPIVLRK